MRLRGQGLQGRLRASRPQDRRGADLKIDIETEDLVLKLEADLVPWPTSATRTRRAAGSTTTRRARSPSGSTTGAASDAPGSPAARPLERRDRLRRSNVRDRLRRRPLRSGGVHWGLQDIHDLLAASDRGAHHDDAALGLGRHRGAVARPDRVRDGLPRLQRQQRRAPQELCRRVRRRGQPIPIDPPRSSSGTSTSRWTRTRTARSGRARPHAVGGFRHPRPQDRKTKIRAHRCKLAFDYARLSSPRPPERHVGRELSARRTRVASSPRSPGSQ